MTLLIEASAAGIPGLPVATSPGEAAASGPPFGDLLSALLAPISGQLAEEPPPDIAANVSGEGEDAAAADQSPADAAGEALSAALALLSLGLAPAPPTIAMAAPQPTAEGDTGAHLPAISALNPAADATAEVPAAPDQSTAETMVTGVSPTDSAGTEPPDGQSPGGEPPGPTEAQPSIVQQSVVRIVGNAESTEPGDTDVAAVGRVSDQPPAGMTLATPSATLGTQPLATVDAPAAPAAPQPLPPTAQVAQAVIERVVEGGGEVRLRLDPPDLGEIVIRVTVDGGHVRVDVQADNAEAARLLREATPNLSTLLGDRGLGLADVSVGHGDREQQGFGEESFNHRGNRDDGSFAALMGIDSSAESRQYNRFRATYNPDGAFLYRV